MNRYEHNTRCINRTQLAQTGPVTYMYTDGHVVASTHAEQYSTRIKLILELSGITTLQSVRMSVLLVISRDLILYHEQTLMLRSLVY